tara:strand:+ start:486 stop:686 length:201 start_codon:yes stop_codon:yes gene_type:complete
MGLSWYNPPPTKEAKEEAERLERGELTPEEIQQNLETNEGCAFIGNIIFWIWVIGFTIVLLAIALS